MISLETRTELKSIGRHVLAVMLIFSFAAAIFLSLMITVPFMRSIYDEVLALAAEGQAIETDALADKLMVYISENEDLVRKCTYIASALCSLLGALVFLRPLRKAGHTIRSLYQKEAFSWGSLGLAILAAVGISYVSSLVVLVTEWLYNHFGLTVLLPEAVPDNSLAALVYALLIAPFMEEFIFRGGCNTPSRIGPSSFFPRRFSFRRRVATSRFSSTNVIEKRTHSRITGSVIFSAILENR